MRSIDKSLALSFILHAADISHPAKRWDVHRQWTERLVEEFFRQGDREKELGLTVSPLCDRNNTAVPDSQVGFINFIVSPTMQLVAEMVERVTVQQIRSALPPSTYGHTRVQLPEVTWLLYFVGGPSTLRQPLLSCCATITPHASQQRCVACGRRAHDRLHRRGRRSRKHRPTLAVAVRQPVGSREPAGRHHVNFEQRRQRPPQMYVEATHSTRVHRFQGV